MIEVCVAVIFSDDGFLLITERPEGKMHALKWEFPGGKIEQNETHHICLKREIREELGVEIDIGMQLLIQKFTYTQCTVQLYFYHCKIRGPLPQGFGLEQQKIAWRKPCDIDPKIMLEADRYILTQLQRNKTK